MSEDTKKALADTIESRPTGMVNFFQTGLSELNKEASHAMDALFAKKGPKTTMITGPMSSHENDLIAASEDTALF